MCLTSWTLSCRYQLTLSSSTRRLCPFHGHEQGSTGGALRSISSLASNHRVRYIRWVPSYNTCPSLPNDKGRSYENVAYFKTLSTVVWSGQTSSSLHIGLGEMRNKCEALSPVNLYITVIGCARLMESLVQYTPHATFPHTIAYIVICACSQ